ncbi:MAG: hypothetical protein RIR18_2188 [Pseudomonadota bacterium]|jgi:DNA repair protein RecN (Recombination protein N)
MLQQLTIRDFVIVDQLDCSFSKGFGVLTGETGAGKSILIDALTMALGERADAGVVRHGCEKADIVAEFSVSDLPEVMQWLVGNDLESDGVLLLRRVIEKTGRSRAYINGSPATALQLKDVGEYLLDVHGQHAHQSLLRSDAQRQLLDAHGGVTGLAKDVSQVWKTLQQHRQALREAEVGSEALLRERDQLVWQVEELSSLGLQAGEWDNLQLEHQRLAHAASLVDGARFALDILSEGDSTSLGLLDSAYSRLEELAAIDPMLEAAVSLLASARVEVEEAVSQLRRYGDKVEQDPERLAAMERRMDAVMSCARKYRVAPEQLPTLLQESREGLERLSEAVDTAHLLALIDLSTKEFQAKAKLLSAKRSETAASLGDTVTKLMGELALGRGVFEVALLPNAEGGPTGFEQVEFRVGGLAGGEPKPMAKVVSGGELSRISLALQVVTSRSASVPTMIFDEVDVGIGGGVAEIVGRMLRSLGEERQVLCVTHLPQVAAKANWQWQVSKSADAEGAVTSCIDVLDKSGRIEEVARMLGGVELTETTRLHASELLGFV